MNIDKSLEEVGLQREDFDVLLEKLDPTKWLTWQLGTLIPRLEWDESLDELYKKFGLEKGGNYLGAHIDTETGQFYGYEKNWPKEKWVELFRRLDQKVILFGTGNAETRWPENIIDLRGKTTFLELTSIVKQCCSHLLAPDSGILSTVYYTAADFPLRIVSLWADPRQGILRQNVPSPNPSLVHVPLIGMKGKVASIPIDQVEKALAGGNSE